MVLRMFSPHILRTLTNFLAFVNFDFFRALFENPLRVKNLFTEYASHMRCKLFLKTSKKRRFGRVQRMWGFLSFFVALLIFLVFFIFIFWGIG